MSEWPRSRTELESKGWSFERRGRCSGKTCLATIEWWRSPAGRWIPLEQTFKTDPNMLVAHHVMCPDVADFKQKPAAEKLAKEPKPAKPVKQKPEKVPQGKLF